MGCDWSGLREGLSKHLKLDCHFEYCLPFYERRFDTWKQEKIQLLQLIATQKQTIERLIEEKKQLQNHAAVPLSSKFLSPTSSPIKPPTETRTSLSSVLAKKKTLMDPEQLEPIEDELEVDLNDSQFSRNDDDSFYEVEETLPNNRSKISKASETSLNKYGTSPVKKGSATKPIISNITPPLADDTYKSPFKVPKEPGGESFAFAGTLSGVMKRYDFTGIETNDYIPKSLKLKGHKKKILSIHHHQLGDPILGRDDGSVICSGGEDKCIKVWNKKTGKEVKVLGTDKMNEIYSLCSHNGLLVSAGDGFGIHKDYTIALWDVASGTCKKLLRGHTTTVCAVVSNRMHLFSGCAQETVKMWDVEAGKAVFTLKTGHSVKNIIWHPQTTCLVSCSSDSPIIQAWDFRQSDLKKPVRAFKGHGDGVNSICEHEGMLCTGSSDNTVKVWDMRSAECLNTIDQFTASVNVVSSTLSGYLCTGSSDNRVMIFKDVEDQEKCLREFNIQEPVFAICSDIKI
jgi:WD40 repeat protein